MPFPTSSFVRSGEFKNVRVIGQGAFGKVYYAEDRLARAVAVKEVLPSAPQFQNVRAQYEKEARIHASLHHQNIVAVYQLLEDQQNGELYMVCEYLNGGSLADYLGIHGKLTEHHAIKITAHICAALEATWAENIVHRDIKPSNILLKLDANNRIASAKLGDFGVAQDKKATHTTIHQGASHPGTPLYMAPEQANSANILDVRADIYALGITLWEMLTCEDYKRLRSQTVSPVLQQYNPTASPGIAGVIQRAVQDEPSHRYSTPQRMADDLRAVYTGKQPPASTLPATPVFLRPAAPTVLATSMSPSHRSVGGILIPLLLVLLLLGLAVSVIIQLRGRSNQTIGAVPSPTSVNAATPIDRTAIVSSGAVITGPIATNTLQSTTVFPTVTPQPTFTPQPEAAQPKSCIQPPAGLISWWPGDGNASDIIGSNNGVLVRGVTFTAGEVGQAFSFDGNGYVLTPATGLPIGADPRTVAFWSEISPSDDTSTGFGYEPPGVTAGKGFYVFPSHSENGGRLTFSGNGSSYDVFAPTDLRDGLYHHVAVTYDGAIVTIYADAVLVASGSLELDTGSGTAFIGGAGGGAGSQFLTGEVDEVAVWNRVLSASEIQAMFSAGRTGMCKTPVPPTPRTLPSEPRSYMVTVQATAPWQDTGVTLNANDTVTIQYVSGTWTSNYRDPNMHPFDGRGPPAPYIYRCSDHAPDAHCVEPIPDFQSAALVGKVGSQLLRIGNQLTFVVETQGNLYLRMNDGDVGLYDNEGAIQVKVSVQP